MAGCAEAPTTGCATESTSGCAAASTAGCTTESTSGCAAASTRGCTTGSARGCVTSKGACENIAKTGGTGPRHADKDPRLEGTIKRWRMRCGVSIHTSAHQLNTEPHREMWCSLSCYNEKDDERHYRCAPVCFGNHQTGETRRKRTMDHHNTYRSYHSSHNTLQEESFLDMQKRR